MRTGFPQLRAIRILLLVIASKNKFGSCKLQPLNASLRWHSYNKQYGELLNLHCTDLSAATWYPCV